MEDVFSSGSEWDDWGDDVADGSGGWSQAWSTDWCEDWLSVESRLVHNPDGADHGWSPSIDLEVGQDAAMTFADDHGMAVCSDSTGNGCVDHISVVGFDGSWSSWQRSTDCETSASPDLLRSEEDTGEQTPPVTPTIPMNNWRVEGWECVERGQWG